MTNTEGTGAPQPGWYPDPAGSAQLRWWDGTAWTAHLQQPAAPQQPAASPHPSAGAAPAYIDPAVYAPTAPTQPSLASGTSIYTPFIWVIALLPLLSAIALAAFNMQVSFSTGGGARNPMLANPMLTDPLYLVISLLGWVVYGVSVWMAYLDWRALGRIGIVRPFHWAWTFLGGIVYVIGRSVVVRRRMGGGGLLPIWIIAAVYVITFIIVIVKVASLISSVISLYNY